MNMCAQMCLNLCDPMDCSPPGSSVHGISQARILQWVAISFARVSSWPRDQTCIFCFSCIGRQILYHWTTWEAPWADWGIDKVNCPWWLSGKESACNAGNMSSIPGLGRSLGEGNGNPLQCSCLENPIDRGAWRSTVHWVAKSWTAAAAKLLQSCPTLCNHMDCSLPGFSVYGILRATHTHTVLWNNCKLTGNCKNRT